MDNLQTDLPRRIACAAIRHQSTGHLICGPRHGNCLNMAVHYGDGDQTRRTWECGFVDQDNIFMDRIEAWSVADKAGQILRPLGFERHYNNRREPGVGDTSMLFSENLY
jgi:hypothetical protein